MHNNMTAMLLKFIQLTPLLMGYVGVHLVTGCIYIVIGSIHFVIGYTLCNRVHTL